MAVEAPLVLEALIFDPSAYGIIDEVYENVIVGRPPFDNGVKISRADGEYHVAVGGFGNPRNSKWALFVVPQVEVDTYADRIAAETVGLYADEVGCDLLRVWGTDLTLEEADARLRQVLSGEVGEVVKYYGGIKPLKLPAENLPAGRQG